MRPAWSIIFFTTISGLGFGLAAWLVLGFVTFANPAELLVVGLAVVALIGAGLVSSTFHLGHPERAWRALSQWRSSWLSREGVLAVLALAGCTMEDVVKTHVYVQDARDFGGFNAVYAGYFPKDPPARTTAEARLMIDIKVEIEAIAYKPL